MKMPALPERGVAGGLHGRDGLASCANDCRLRAARGEAVTTSGRRAGRIRRSGALEPAPGGVPTNAARRTAHLSRTLCPSRPGRKVGNHARRPEFRSGRVSQQRSAHRFLESTAAVFIPRKCWHHGPGIDSDATLSHAMRTLSDRNVPIPGIRLLRVWPCQPSRRPLSRAGRRPSSDQ